MDADSDYIADRRVLITGAGGSIGSELCRQIHALRPAAMVMLDRDESGLHETQLSIHGRALLDGRDVVLADIRDADRIGEVFREHRPEIVFHAAALKHQPLLEQYPAEAVKTNVLGTATILEAAEAIGTEILINISTDKAVDPVCVLGMSKRVAERLTANYAPRRFLSVRFGNVLGSRGSVLSTFAAQIAAGGPVTVTHPDMTRYFMTVWEAVRLVIGAGAVGKPGEALVLDMGEPVRILDLVTRMAGSSIPIVFTGIRPGESLWESPLGAGETPIDGVRSPIARVTVPPISPTETKTIDVGMSASRIGSALLALCEMGF